MLTIRPARPPDLAAILVLEQRAWTVDDPDFGEHVSLLAWDQRDFTEYIRPKWRHVLMVVECGQYIHGFFLFHLCTPNRLTIKKLVINRDHQEGTTLVTVLQWVAEHMPYLNREELVVHVPDQPGWEKLQQALANLRFQSSVDRNYVEFNVDSIRFTIPCRLLEFGAEFPS